MYMYMYQIYYLFVQRFSRDDTASRVSRYHLQFSLIILHPPQFPDFKFIRHIWIQRAQSIIIYFIIIVMWNRDYFSASWNFQCLTIRCAQQCVIKRDSHHQYAILWDGRHSHRGGKRAKRPHVHNTLRVYNRQGLPAPLRASP